MTARTAGTMRSWLVAGLCASASVASADDAVAPPNETRAAQAKAGHEEALRLARAGDFVAAARASGAAVAASPEWAEARFVHAGLLTRLARAAYDPALSVRRGVDYAGAARAFSTAHDDLRRYLELRPWAENRGHVDIAIRQLAELATSASTKAATIAAWDAHQYPLRGSVDCRADPYQAFWFELEGKRVTSVPAGEHTVTLRTEDCGSEQRVVSRPLYNGGAEQYVDLSFVLQPPGPGQQRIDATLAPALELVHASTLTLLRESDGRQTGAQFDGGATLLGTQIRFTGRDRGGWRVRWALQGELGVYRGSAMLSSYSSAPGEPSVTTGEVDVNTLRAGFSVRVQRAWHRLRAFGSAGLALDRWSIAADAASAVSMLRAPLAIGIEAMHTCKWRLGARVQYSPILPVDSANGFATVDVSGSVTRAWCGDGRGVTVEGLRELSARGPAAQLMLMGLGVGVDQIYAGDDFSMRSSLFTGEEFGAVFTGGTTITGPTFYMHTLDFGRTLRGSVELMGGYYAGTSRLVHYTPASGDSSVGGLPRDVDVHAYQVGPALNFRLPLVRVSPFVSVGFMTEYWNMSEADSPITAFRFPLTGGLELLASCRLRLRVHARYSPGIVLGIQEDFTTMQIGAAIYYARCMGM